jgi:hypothetical protein
MQTRTTTTNTKDETEAENVYEMGEIDVLKLH